MGTRAPTNVQHYNLRSSNSFAGTALHDLNTVDDTRPAEIDGIGDDVDREALADEDDLEHEGEPNAADCVHESFRNSLPLHGVGVEEDRIALENSEPSRSPYGVLAIDVFGPDISPIETARSRFLQIVVDHYLRKHVVEVVISSEAEYCSQSGQDKLNKRKPKEFQYEGDSRFLLPLMYVANLYETLVNDVNMRLASLDVMREKTIGVALEAAGGLYRRLARKFPRKGPCSFKRRELATSVETRTKFPELVVQDEKRVRFVVVHGLEIVEKPDNMAVEDAEWFKRLTGRHEVAISERDYKFYSPRHKYRRVLPPSVQSILGLPTQNQQQSQSRHPLQPLSHQPQYHPLHQSIHQCQHGAQFPHSHHCAHSSHVQEIPHTHQQPSMPQHIPCLQPLSGAHVGGRMHVLPTSPAKFCDECGAPYLRETSKFCSECGIKRLGT